MANAVTIVDNSNATNKNSKMKRRNIVLKQIVRSGLILACGLLTTVAYMTATDQPANSSPESAVHHPAVAVFRFVGKSESVTDSTALSAQACAEYNGSAKSGANISGTSAASAQDNLIVGPEILDAIFHELEQRVSKKKMSIMVDPDPETVPDGALLIGGCIFKVGKGGTIDNLFGFPVGESRLGAHIIFLSKGRTGVIPLDSFDLVVKGMWIDGAEDPHENLSLDAGDLADKVVRKLGRDMKRWEQISTSQTRNAEYQARTAAQTADELRSVNVAAVLAMVNQRISELSEETEAAIAQHPDAFRVFPFGGPMFVISGRFPWGESIPVPHIPATAKH